jgi:hypothetical protein
VDGAWDSFREEGIVAIGPDFLGDLREYDSREEIHEAIANKEVQARIR